MPKTHSPFNNYCLEIIQFLKKIFEFLHNRNPELPIDLSIFEVERGINQNTPGKIIIKPSPKQNSPNCDLQSVGRLPKSSKIENPFTLKNLLRQSLRETDSKFREEMIKRLDAQRPPSGFFLFNYNSYFLIFFVTIN